MYMYTYVAHKHIYICSSCTCIHTHATNTITLRIPYSVFMWWGNIGKFGESTAIRQCFTYRYFPYPNIFNRRLLSQLHTWMSPCIVRLLLYLSFKISLSHLPAVDSVIVTIKIVAITGQPLCCFYLPYVLIARCVSLIYSEFKHTQYYTLSSITHV